MTFIDVIDSNLPKDGGKLSRRHASQCLVSSPADHQLGILCWKFRLIIPVLSVFLLSGRESCLESTSVSLAQQPFSFFSYRKFLFSGKSIPCTIYGDRLFPHRQRGKYMSWAGSPYEDEGECETKASQYKSSP